MTEIDKLNINKDGTVYQEIEDKNSAAQRKK